MRTGTTKFPNRGVNPFTLSVAPYFKSRMEIRNPKNRLPESPMKILAGLKLNMRNAASAPANAVLDVVIIAGKPAIKLK